MIDLADTIRRTITMHDVCALYGYTPNHAGYINCPIHKERTPSLKIYSGNGGWHCFGCGAGGSVIDFVMHIFNINFRQAVTRICNDFGIRQPAVTSEELAELRRKNRERERAQQEYTAEYDAKHREYVKLKRILAEKQPKAGDTELDAEYAEALRRLPYLEHWFENNHYKRGETD